MAGMFEDYINTVKGRLQDPLGTLANALKEGTTLTKENPFGMFGAGAMTKGQAIYRGTKRIPDMAVVSQRLQNPGNEFGMHVTVDPNTADLMQYNYQGGDKGGIIGMKSNVDKPLTLPDTGGRWSPDIVIDQILKNKHMVTGAKEKSVNIGTKENPLFIKDYVLPKQLEKDLLSFKNNYKQTIDKEGATEDVVNSGAKELQSILKKNGFDHISYTNKREGVPSESAILFDNLSYKDPFPMEVPK